MLLSLLVFTLFQTVSSGVAPQVIPFKLSEHLEEGQRLGIVCSVSKGTLPISFQWRKANALVIPSADVKISHEDYQESLQIMGLNSQHVGNYTCSVKNAFGSDQMSVRVILNFKPRWAMKNMSRILNAVTGETTFLNCEAVGYPVPTIRISKGSYVVYKYNLLFIPSLIMQVYT
ncbi:hemicentin-2-like [Tropilaelaps mercedesae]|uniref:Hemicentin-2-like n=1 Tax=Tropilaelaps mercedesae TaxID=418985 RepID=A0A1V9Y0C8_9ACAR|nr:hemicentin-2-like [Tropilaelaps mercedesae]